MTQTETTWDKLLQIKTTGRDDSHADRFHHPYEPTPYSVLERLGNKGFIGKRDVVLDYGCGKGRVDFFLAYQTKARTVGIEYDERLSERGEQSENRRLTNKDGICPCECGNLCRAAGGEPVLFLQSVFRGDSSESDGANHGILVRKSAGDSAVFLLPGGCVYFLSHVRGRAGVC